MMRIAIALTVCLSLLPGVLCAADNARATAFYEKKIRPLLIQHCYECHSEKANEQSGGLLLDRRSAWLKGGETDKAVVPGNPDASLLIEAVRYENENLQMPPENRLSADQVKLLEQWVRLGAPGPAKDIGDTEFSRLGDQDYLFSKAADHWAFQPVAAVEPPSVGSEDWSGNAIDRFVYRRLAENGLTPSARADARTLLRRLTYDLTGLPPTYEEVTRFTAAMNDDPETAVAQAIDRLIESPAYGEHIARLWLDVARYADTDSFYRPDTRTPHRFPFAFTYRDYVVDAFNKDKPFDRFVREQLAADLMGFEEGDAELAALGFLAVGPHANRNRLEALDDWIDLTTRGLMGLTAACARCHDHKFEPIPTTDYYALRGVFASVARTRPLNEQQCPKIPGYEPSEADKADYQKKRAALDKKIEKAGKNRAATRKIIETEVATLLSFHPGAPVHAMVVRERNRPDDPYVFVRGDADNRGETVPRRFLKILDPQQNPFPEDSSGRLELADNIVSPENPLTARVLVNRVFGYVTGSHLVATPSDFGLQGARPTHPELLDWLAADFVAHGWSVKHLVRTIVSSRTYQQRSDVRPEMAARDPENRWLWRANRKHLSIEALRDSLLSVSRQLDRRPRGRPAPLWGEDYTRRRSIYGYINRFNLDPTLRAFDFPAPMRTQPARGESIVAPQALFAMNAPFVIDQAAALTESEGFAACRTDEERVRELFRSVLQREPEEAEITHVTRFVEDQSQLFEKDDGLKSPWPLVAQALMMSNEFQYLD